MKRVLDLSFSICFGAGGWSISHEFRCIFTVDNQSAPAFCLMTILDYALISCGAYARSGISTDMAITVTEWENIFNSVLEKMRWLYENGLASPADVDQFNQNIMCLVMSVV